MKGSTWLIAGLILSAILVPGFGWFVWTSLEQAHADGYQARLSFCESLLKLENIGVLGLKTPLPKDEQDKALAANQVKYQKCRDDAQKAFLADDFSKTLKPIVAAIDTVTVLIGWLVGWLLFLELRRIKRAYAPA